jgi:hypothetical protein
MALLRNIFGYEGDAVGKILDGLALGFLISGVLTGLYVCYGYLN